MLKTGHRIAGVLFGTNMWCASQIALPDPANPFVVGAAAAVAVAVSTWNDWDHNYYKNSWNPAIGLVRQSARFGYTFHTQKDRARWEQRARRYSDTWEPGDLHRGPTHCIEWCSAFGLIVALICELGLAPFGIAGWWFGMGVFVGTASHVCADALTPSGVPFSAVYNWLKYGEVWRRHAVGWRIPLEHVTWNLNVGPVEYELAYLTWIRYPSIVPSDERHPGCRPGICRSDRAGDHLFQLYMALPATAISLLLWLGAFSPVAHALTWGAWPV